MSEATHSAGYSGTSRGFSLAKIGGALGIAGAIIGIAIFVLGCFGFSAAFSLSLIPLILGVPGLVLTIIGGFQKNPGLEDPGVVASYLINIAVISGALLLMSVWLNWSFFAGGTTTTAGP
jgi:hypothetical protein